MQFLKAICSWRSAANLERENSMGKVIVQTLYMYGIAIVISFFVAFIIKIIYSSIKLFKKD